MHSEIREFPSEHFYSSLITDHPVIRERERHDFDPSLAAVAELFKKRVVLLDLVGCSEDDEAVSKRNVNEAVVTRDLLEVLNDLTEFSKR